MRNSSPILVLGSVNVDLVTRGTRLPVAGETVIGAEFFQAAGGKGANQAVAAARLSNGAVTLVAAVGDDPFGRQSLDRFRDENLVVDYIKTVPNSPTGVALIMVDQHGENCISVASGANRDLSPEDVAVIPDAVFQSARVFLTCLESPWSTVAAGLQRARSAGLTTILNPAPASAELAGHPMLRDVDIVTPNEGEAEQLTGTHLDRDHSLQTAAQRLRQAGVGDVVFTLGVRGAAIFDGSLTSLPASASEVVDTTAAGDAFNGALAVGLAEGKSLQQAVQTRDRGRRNLRFAIWGATFVAHSRGGCIAHRPVGGWRAVVRNSAVGHGLRAASTGREPCLLKWAGVANGRWLRTRGRRWPAAIGWVCWSSQRHSDRLRNQVS